MIKKRVLVIEDTDLFFNKLKFLLNSRANQKGIEINFEHRKNYMSAEKEIMGIIKNKCNPYDLIVIDLLIPSKEEIKLANDLSDFQGLRLCAMLEESPCDIDYVAMSRFLGEVKVRLKREQCEEHYQKTIAKTFDKDEKNKEIERGVDELVECIMKTM